MFTRSIQRQKIFYHNVLGLHIVQEHSNCIRFKVGVSELIFKESNNANPMHFACNIPFESIISAKKLVMRSSSSFDLHEKGYHRFCKLESKSIIF